MFFDTKNFKQQDLSNNFVCNFAVGQLASQLARYTVIFYYQAGDESRFFLPLKFQMKKVIRNYSLLLFFKEVQLIVIHQIFMAKMKKDQQLDGKPSALKEKFETKIFFSVNVE